MRAAERAMCDSARLARLVGGAARPGLASLALLVATPDSSAAQAWVLKVPEPPLESARITRDVRFAEGDASGLLMDVYRPAARAAAPALIFYTMYWPAEGGSNRLGEWYRNWGRLAAAHGVVGIVPDLRALPGTGNATAPARPLGDDFHRLLSHLTRHAADYGIDPERIAVFAASGATWAALPEIQDPRMTSIKAAVLYYGSGPVDSFRPDLPLLWVRAGLDSPRTNAEIDRASALALSQNAPLTLINHATGRHGFEGRDDTPATHRVIEQTFDFVRRATVPSPRS